MTAYEIPHNDPFDVLRSTRRVVQQARNVRINLDVIDAVAARLLHAAEPVPAWRGFPHWWSDDASDTATYVLALDAMNFCFWGEPRWTVTVNGAPHNGYMALAAALTAAVQRGEPVLDPGWLQSVSEDELQRVLGGVHELPMLAERAANLRELGHALSQRFGGRASNFLAEAQGSAIRTIELVLDYLPSFRDSTLYDGEPVALYKRAQILAGDLAAALENEPLSPTKGLNLLTAFADYKVPQVLRELGVIDYTPELAATIQANDELIAGSPPEVEIRAATIWGVELLRASLSRQNAPIHAYEVDWLLWTMGQTLDSPRPYHRTRTIFY